MDDVCRPALRGVRGQCVPGNLLLDCVNDTAKRKTPDHAMLALSFSVQLLETFATEESGTAEVMNAAILLSNSVTLTRKG